MFSIKQDALLYSLNPIEQVVLLPGAHDRRVWDKAERTACAEAAARAELAMRASIPMLTASDFARRLSGDGAFFRAYTARREMIKALALGACAQGGARFAEKLGDLLYAVCEETDWSISGKNEYPDDESAQLDVNACETGALLACAATLCKTQLNRLSPAIYPMVARQVCRRVLNRFIESERGDFLDADDRDMARVCAATATALMLVERDERRRWLCLRRVIRLAEGYLQALPGDGSLPGGLEASLDVACSVGDLFSVLGAASGGVVELRDDKLFVGMARAFVLSYIGQGWFLNPGGQSMRPQLSPDRLYRLGEGARDAELCSLAAYLRRGATPPHPALEQATESLYGQAMNLLYRESFMRETAREPLYESACLYGAGILAGRMGPFFAALTGGDNLSPNAHLDAGDVTLFYQGQPVLIDVGERPDARYHGVPVISGFEQKTGLRGGSDAEVSRNAGCLILSMNIAGAYPEQAGLQSWQRTVMFAPFEGGVRVMDVFDFDHAQGVAIFRFLTPFTPRLQVGGARLGPVNMTWDDHRLSARVQPLTPDTPAQRLLWGESIYLVELQMNERGAGGNYSFAFTPAEE